MKYIKVTGCHDCPKQYHLSNYPYKGYCRMNHNRDVSKNHLNKTFHSNCPLDDHEEVKKEMSDAESSAWDEAR